MEDWDAKQKEIIEVRQVILKHLSAALISLTSAETLCQKNMMWLMTQEELGKVVGELHKIKDELPITTLEIRGDR